jgi:hypothetical protein
MGGARHEKFSTGLSLKNSERILVEKKFQAAPTLKILHDPLITKKPPFPSHKTTPENTSFSEFTTSPIRACDRLRFLKMSKQNPKRAPFR